MLHNKYHICICSWTHWLKWYELFFCFVISWMFHWNSSKIVFGWIIEFSFLSLWYPSIWIEITDDLSTSFDYLHSCKMLIFIITIFVKAKMLRPNCLMLFFKIFIEIFFISKMVYHAINKMQIPSA